MIHKPSTAELLAASLKELAKTKAVDKITIKELTANCGLTPPTFYNHFRDKYDLMAWICNERLEKIIARLGADLTFEEAARQTLELLFEDEAFYSNVLRNAVGQNSFRYATNDHSIMLITEWIKARYGAVTLTPEILFHVRFYMRAFSETANDWYLGKWNCSAAEMARLIVEAMPAPLKPLLLNI